MTDVQPLPSILDSNKEQSKERNSLNSLINIKTIFFYPGIIMSVGWIVLNIIQMSHHIEQLKNENPECTTSNPNKWVISISTIVGLLIFKSPIETYSTKLFIEYLPTANFPIGSKVRETRAIMLGERIVRLIVNSFCVAMLVIIMSREDCDFMDVRVGGRESRPLYYANYPCQKLPKYLDDFYVFKLSYHLFELFYSIIM